MNATRSGRWAAEWRKQHVGRRLPWAAALVLGLCWAGTVAAQETKDEIPTPEDIGGAELLTRDGVQLKATFYGSNKARTPCP